MTVLALPVSALRAGRKLAGRLTLPALAGAVALIYRAARRPTAAPSPAAAAPAEHETVVDAVPLAEAAVDLDVEVILASVLAIPSYDALRASDAVQAIRELSDPDEVRTVLAFEEENAKRSTVLTAARAHLAALAVRG